MHKKHGAGITPPADIVTAVRRLVDEAETERSVYQRLGISASSMTRLRGGLPVRAGTIAQVRERLRGE